MVAPLPEPVDPGAVSAVLLGGSWVAVQRGSFRVGTLRLGAGASGESIRNEIWFDAALEDGDGRLSGPFGALQAVRH